MKLLFKQRFFSWFDTYDIYDESGNTVFVVKGEVAWGHLLRIYDTKGNEVGYIKEKFFSWLPKFEMYINDRYAGCISKEFSFWKPKLASMATLSRQCSLTLTHRFKYTCMSKNASKSSRA